MHLERGGRAVEGAAQAEGARRREGGERRAAAARCRTAATSSARSARSSAGNPATAEKVKTAFLFKLSAPESAWTIDLATPPGNVTEGAVGKAGVHARDERRRLHGDGDRPGRRDEAVLDRQAEDHRRRDGVAEARLPEEADAGDGARRDEETDAAASCAARARRRRPRRPPTTRRPPRTCSP